MDNAPKPQDESTRSEEERKAAAGNDPNAPAPANGGAGAPTTPESSQSGSFKAVFGSGQGSNPWSGSGGQNPWDDGPGGQSQNDPSAANAAGQSGNPQDPAGQEGGPWGNIGLAGPPSQRLGAVNKNPSSQVDAASKVLDASSGNQSEEARKAAQDMLLNDPWLNPAAGWVQMVLPSKEGEAAPSEGAPTGGPQSAKDGDSAADFLSAWGDDDAPSLPKGPSALKGLGVSLNPSKSGNVIPEPLPRLAPAPEPETESEDDALGLDPHDRLFPVGQGGRNEPSEAYQKLFDTGSHPIIQLEDRMTAPEGMGIQDRAVKEKPTGPQPPPPPEPAQPLQPVPSPSAPEPAPPPPSAASGPPPLPAANPAPAAPAASPPAGSAAPPPLPPPVPDAPAPQPVAPAAAVPPNAAPHMQPMPPAHSASAPEPPKPAQPGWMRESGGLTSTQTGLPALHPPQQQLPSWLSGSQQQQSQQLQQQAQQLPQQSAPPPAQPPQAPPPAPPEPAQAAAAAPSAPAEPPRPTTPPPLPPQHQQAFPPEGPPTQQGLPAQHQHVPGWMLESPAQRAAKEQPTEPAAPSPVEKPQQQLPSWLQSQSTQTNLPAQPDPFQQQPASQPQPVPAEPPAAAQETPPAPAAPPPPPPAPEPVAPVSESPAPPPLPAPPPSAPPPVEQPAAAEPFDQTVPPFPTGQPSLQPISETPTAPPPLPAAPPPLPTAAPNYTPQATQQAPVQQPPQQSMPPLSSQGGFVSYQQSAPPPQAPQTPPPPAPPSAGTPPPLPAAPAASPYDPMQAHAELEGYAQAARFQSSSGNAAPTPPPLGLSGSDQVSSGQHAPEGTGSHHSLLPPHKPHRQPDDDGELSADELRAMRRKKTTDALRRATTSDEAEPETEEEAETKANIAKIGPVMTMGGIAVATILLLGAFGLLINYMMGHGEANSALKVAQSFLRQGNPKEARRTLDPLVKQGTKDAGVYAALGECALQMKDNADAIKNYTEAVNLDPKDPAYLVGRAGAYLEAGRGEDALKDANAALALNPNYADGLKVRALAYARTFDYPKSLDDSDEYLRRNSNPPADAYATRALALLHMKRYAEAVDDYSRAARMDSTKGEYVAGKAEALKNAGQYREAIAAVEKALNMMGRRIELLRLRGDCYVLNNQLDEAIKDYEAVASISPAKDNLVRTADVAMKANQFNMANYYYTKALEIDPKDTRIKTLKDLASKNVASKAVVISVPTQPTSSSISPAIIAKSSPSQLNSMGVRYMGSGYYQEAASLFAAALKRQPKNIEARRQLTQCYLQLGQRSEAKAQIRTLVSMKALSAYDAQYFARSLLALNDAADVPGFLWPVLRSHKLDFSLRATLIQALMASRQNSQAMQVAAEGAALAQREQDKAMMQEYLRTAQQAPYGRR